MTKEERRRERRRRIVAHRARSFADAERWDLDYWQSMTPEDRLSALVALRRDLEAVGRTVTAAAGSGVAVRAEVTGTGHGPPDRATLES